MLAFIIRQLVRLVPWDFLAVSITELGWDIAVEDADELEGLVIGTEDYIDRHILDKRG